MRKRRPDIAIIGPGKVGTVLGSLAAKAGYRVVGVGGRKVAKARRAAKMISPGTRAGPVGQIAPLGRLVLLSVADDAIESVCRKLAKAGAFAKGAVVAHCSGALASDVLSSARELCGAAVGSMHPLQTFPNIPAGLEKLPGTFFFCEGDGRAAAALKTLASAIGGRPVAIRPAGKLLYHASAVLACNCLTALLDAALASAELAGIGRADARAALAPLVRATLDNVFAHGPEAALTGPVARGDYDLVRRQFAAVRAARPALGEVYRALGLWTVQVALRKGTLDRKTASRLRRVLR